MNTPALAYTDMFVKNLLSITESNVSLQDAFQEIDKNNPKFIELEETLKSEILFQYMHCINISIAFKDSRKFALGMNKPPENSKERMMLNIRNVLDYINASFTNERFGLPLLVHLNKLALDDIKDVWEISKMIVSEGEIDSSFDFENKDKVVMQNDMPSYIRSLEDYLATAQQPDMVKIAMIFYEVSHSHLFACGNDATALAMMLFMYRKIGLHPYINFSKCLNNLQHVRQKTMDAESMEVWLEMFFFELAKETKELRSRFSPFLEEVRVEHTSYVDLNLRQIKGLAYIKEKGKISREIYGRLNNVSQITSYRDLTGLLQKGYVRVEGIGKGTKYVL